MITLMRSIPAMLLFSFCGFLTGVHTSNQTKVTNIEILHEEQTTCQFHLHIWSRFITRKSFIITMGF